MAKRKKRFSAPLTVFLSVVCLIVGVAVGFAAMTVYGMNGYESDKAPSVMTDGELQIHFLELGNYYTGDCTYIKAGDTDILIDAGSRTSSIDTISAYLDKYVTDGKLEYVIVTHAHQDHYAGFTKENGSIFDLYECETIIDFALTNQKSTAKLYNEYLSERDAEIEKGAVHYTAAACRESNNYLFDLGNGIKMEILDSKYYYEKASSENDYSVCTLFTYGDNSYLFTGDLEAGGEKELVKRNNLPEVTLYKAGHHGSKTSSSNELLSVIKPEIVCVCCCAGSNEYRANPENRFPSQAFVDRVAPYTDKVYVTTICTDDANQKFASMNGNITVITDADGVRVVCSNDDRVLKLWEWFLENRTCPAAWKN